MVMVRVMVRVTVRVRVRRVRAHWSHFIQKIGNNSFQGEKWGMQNKRQAKRPCERGK